MQAAYDKVKEASVAGVYGKRYIPDKNTDPDTMPDFPYIEDPEGYVTHVPLEQDEVREQGEEGAAQPTMAKPADAGADAGADIGNDAEGGIGDMGMDDQGNMPGVDPNTDMGAMGGIGGMGEQKEELTANQIGRVYELKKIYSRLASVESFLARTTDESILEIRKLVAQSIDLFELVISNYDQYKDKVDEIIVMYYEFLDSVYTSMKNYFAEMSKE